MVSDVEPLLRYLRPGDGVIDVGANDGGFTRHFAKMVGPTGTVLAIEPDPLNVATLRETVKDSPWVEIVETAVADPCWLARKFYRDTGNRKRNSFWEPNLLGAPEMFTVTCCALDELAARVPRLRGVKIDTQGAELEVLAGATETLKRPDLMWMIELWPTGVKHAGGSVQELADVFMAHGYHPTEGTWESILRNLRDYSGHQSTDVFLTYQGATTSPDRR